MRARRALLFACTHWWTSLLPTPLANLHQMRQASVVPPSALYTSSRRPAGGLAPPAPTPPATAGRHVVIFRRARPAPRLSSVSDAAGAQHHAGRQELRTRSCRSSSWRPGGLRALDRGFSLSLVTGPVTAVTGPVTAVTGLTGLDRLRYRPLTNRCVEIFLNLNSKK
jgi:hypothetical protein